MKKLIAVIVLLGLILLGAGLSQARKYQFYWERTKAALDAITTAIHGDVGMVITSDNTSDNATTFYYHNGTAWVVAPVTGTQTTSPSTQVYAAPTTVYGGNDTLLGAPTGFMLVPVGGVQVKVPYY